MVKTMENNTVKEKKKFNKAKFFTAIAFVLTLVGLMVFLFSGDNFDIIKNLFRNDVTKEEVRESLSSLASP